VRSIEQGELIDGRYLVQGFLGLGIVSLVYLAIDIQQTRPVAVKVLRSRFLEMPGLAAPNSSYPMSGLLRREIQIHRDVHHPRIVELFDDGTWDDRLFAALEYVADPSVEEQFPDPLETREAVAIVRQVLEGLAYLHDSGIIHRDLKPEHIHFGGEHGVKLLDLGLAMHVDEPDATSIVSIMGSQRYGAPEQHRLQGRHVPTTTRSDVFSAAATLERLLYGNRARRGEDPARDAVLPTALSELLDSAMSSDPLERPRDARELDAQLAALDLG
jgi:serine/threonine protein kinase